MSDNNAYGEYPDRKSFVEGMKVWGGEFFPDYVKDEWAVYVEKCADGPGKGAEAQILLDVQGILMMTPERGRHSSFPVALKSLDRHMAETGIQDRSGMLQAAEQFCTSGQAFRHYAQTGNVISDDHAAYAAQKRDQLILHSFDGVMKQQFDELEALEARRAGRQAGDRVRFEDIELEPVDPSLIPEDDIPMMPSSVEEALAFGREFFPAYKQDDWKEFVEESMRGSLHGADVGLVMSAEDLLIDGNAKTTFPEVRAMLDRGLDGRSFRDDKGYMRDGDYDSVMMRVCEFCDQGQAFWCYRHTGEIVPADEAAHYVSGEYLSQLTGSLAGMSQREDRIKALKAEAGRDRRPIPDDWKDMTSGSGPQDGDGKGYGE